MSLQSEPASCVAMVILLHYCLLTNFFWMFVEGKIHEIEYYVKNGWTKMYGGRKSVQLNVIICKRRRNIVTCSRNSIFTYMVHEA